MSARRGLRGWARLLLGGAIAVGLLIWALRGISVIAVWEAVRAAELAWLGFGLLSYLGSFGVRARRWGTLVSANCSPGSFRLRHAAIYIGFAVNNILPARAGEVSRAVVLARAGGVPLGVALGSVVAERMLDGVIVFCLLLIALAIGTAAGSFGASVEPSQVLWIGLVLVSLSITVIVAARWPAQVARLVGRTSSAIGLKRFAERLESITRSLLAGLEALRDPGRATVAMIETLVIWGLTAFTYWAGLCAFGINGPGVVGSVFVMVVVALAISIPSSPGQFGPFEAGVRLALSAFAVPSSVIVAYGLTLHVLVYVSVSVIGVPLAVRYGFSWRDLARGETGSTRPVTREASRAHVRTAPVGGS